MSRLRRFFANGGARTGIFFGATSGVITTLGLITGLYAGTESLVAVLGGILIVAVADAMSDALGIHLAEESVPGATEARIWAATLSTFLSKLVVASSFALPLLWLPLAAAVAVSVVWGFLVISVMSIYLARRQHVAILPVVGEHLLITIGVLLVSYFIGGWVKSAFA